ncbi:flagellar assembly protein FliW [Rhodococcus sp. X156]|uniref:flagellar assembly protein FliW n=1 Tax=Rhodococcus sp. X156 TaxID=2499145 RepID=UPI001F499797|nr:flagellar assembly protein FliW [Rhodococcus sp. X156]
MTVLDGPTTLDGPAVTASGAPAAALPRTVRLAEPIPGFPDHHEFTLDPVDEGGVLYALRSARTPSLRFILADPATFFPDYSPAISAADLGCLGVADDEEVSVLVIVTLTDRLDDATANLLAPVVIAPRLGTGVQLVLRDTSLSLRVPLLASAR